MRTLVVNHGKNVRRFRLFINMKQETLGELIDEPQSEVSKLENEPVIAIEKLRRISSALKIPVELLQFMPDNDNEMINFMYNTLTDNSIGIVIASNFYQGENKKTTAARKKNPPKKN